MSDVRRCISCKGEHTGIDILCAACEAEVIASEDDNDECEECGDGTCIDCEGGQEAPDAEHTRENRSTHAHVSRSSYTR